MKKISFIIVLFSVICASCGSSKRSSTVSTRKTVITEPTQKSNTSAVAKTKKTTSATKKRSATTKENKKIKSIIAYAKTFEGTRYKYGGTTKKGMDCSGLVYTSFKKEEIVLPRTSRAMSAQGSKVSLRNVAVGDLLFFKTNKKKNVISHVGLVVTVGNQVKFIHSSTSKGVTVSSLDEKYWNTAFAWARRIL
ncbi:C40 family peptidase [Aquimarina addita]|uniref:C40 family peptidase n=1 Tax=Aquimarina addita TaxID=870485 RepID=UPI0031EBDFB2